MLSVFAFVAQLDDTPDEWEMVERRACTRLFRGPSGWITPGCLRDLKHFGFPSELPDLKITATAAKCRVHSYEDHRDGGLRVS